MGLAIIAVLLIITCIWQILLERKLEGSESHMIFKEEGSLAWPSPRLVDALSCVGPRAAVLDVLGGAPYEFTWAASAREAMYLHRLAKAAAPQDSTAAEEQLRDVVQQLLRHGGGSPTLQRRLIDALSTPCEASKKCAAQGAGSEPLSLVVDQAATTQPAKTESTWMHKFLTHTAAATGIESFRTRAESLHSKPPEVVLRPDVPLHLGTCFAWRNNASMAFRLPGEGKTVRHIVIDQVSRWATYRPQASPRRFSVYGDFGTKEYEVPLGTFEYRLAAPAVQAFKLEKEMTLHGFRIIFESPGWSTEVPTCLYRIRAYEGLPPSCSGGRLAMMAP